MVKRGILTGGSIWDLVLRRRSAMDAVQCTSSAGSQIGSKQSVLLFKIGGQS